jgi:hypothetical protein
MFIVHVLDPPEEVGSEADESSSENEGEFVPSCWDSMAQPQRSALKSPDKANEVSVEIYKNNQNQIIDLFPTLHRPNVNEASHLK